MARLRVLYLPARALPDGDERRFGLVFDQLDTPLTYDERAEFDNFAQACGAEGMLETTRTVDCDQGEDDIDWPEEFAGQMREMVDGRIGEHMQAMLARRQEQQKPPPHTAEGKAARTWGGSGQDPRDAIRAQYGQVSAT
jgi:hypothetical protein